MSRIARLLFPPALALCLLELVLRLLTRGGEFAGVPLLPLDPAAAIRAATGADLASAYLVFDAELGWSVGPSRRSANGLYLSDPEGLRIGNQQVSPNQPAWAVCFGDSFTHGDDVPWEGTWQHALSERLGAPVLNAGVPGYGVDQAWLRYRRLATRLAAPRVLIGLMADNIGRHLNRYRPFISSQERIFYAKPRFLLEAGNLVPLPQPFARLEDYFAPDLEERLAELGQQDRWYRAERYAKSPWDSWRTARVLRSAIDRRRASGTAWRDLYRDPEAVALSQRLVSEFAREVRARGRDPVVVFFPDQTLCQDALRGRPPVAAPLLSALAADGVRVIDLTAPLAAFLATQADPGQHFLPHYSAALNRQVADHLAATISR